ncbi:hypothetical protein ACFYS7_35070 [Streptomyces avermitilis]|uniref:hypothetical protein n=1 Tax=Streptomyces avermitilis TaxID=33903 RepID=UPI0036AB719F
MAAGLTLSSEDLKPYGNPRARSAGWAATYYPIKMVRLPQQTPTMVLSARRSAAAARLWPVPAVRQRIL